MQKNVAGQRIGVQMVSASDGTAFTGSVTVYVTGDAGSQAIGSVGSGICTHEGNGYHSYAPAQAETNYDLIAFTFTGSGAVPVTVQVYTAINPVTAVPTAAANATAVRSELATELGRIDVATSTRLAAGSYTAPPTAATVAGAVWDKATVDHTSTGSFGAIVGALPLAPAIADAVWDEAMSGHTINGTYGSHIVRSANQNQNTVSITGSQHIAADVHAFQANAIDAAAIAASAVTEIQSGLATSNGVTAAFTEIKGATWSSATDTLEQIRDASGGSGDTIMVTPVVAQVPVRVVGTNIETFIGDLSDIRVGVFSGEDPVDLSGFGDLEICVQTKGGVDLDFVEMANITIDGTDNNYFSWTPSGPSVSQVRSGAKWSLRKSSNKQVIAYGAWIVVDAALEDTGS